MDLKNFVTGLTIADKIYLYNTLYKDLACEGIDGDTELAHVNVQEMSVLRAMGGSGTINPNTNLLQFGGGGSPPPPPPATQTVTQQATIPDELKPFITDILEKSKAIQERREEEGYVPFQGPRIADFTEEQQTAFEGIQGLQGAGQPFFDRSTALTEASAQAPTAQSVSDFSNPFIQNVIDIQKREAQRLGDVERQQIGAQAVQAGGFGGSRHAILEAEQSRNLQQQLGDIQSRGSAAAFEDAQARLQQQRERERQAGAQFAGLGSQVPGQRLREITGLEAVGAQKQSLGQAGIDIAAQEFEIGRSFPERTLQDYQSIVRGYAQPIPASTLQRASSQQPAPSFLSQAAGLGAAGIGAFKAFGGNAQGGLVGLAEGGLPAGGTALESSTEAISTRAQNDPLTQVERPPLSQGQQFVRGQENQEAATVEDQLQQIQGLALGATNAIAQGQQKLATMNTAPGMGAQPANFGGNVGSFGFKKGGLLGLKHLANGGTVRLANGSQPKDDGGIITYDGNERPSVEISRIPRSILNMLGISPEAAETNFKLGGDNIPFTPPTVDFKPISKKDEGRQDTSIANTLQNLSKDIFGAESGRSIVGSTEERSQSERLNKEINDGKRLSVPMSQAVSRPTMLNLAESDVDPDGELLKRMRTIKDVPVGPGMSVYGETDDTFTKDSTSNKINLENSPVGSMAEQVEKAFMQPAGQDEGLPVRGRIKLDTSEETKEEYNIADDTREGGEIIDEVIKESSTDELGNNLNKDKVVDEIKNQQKLNKELDINSNVNSTEIRFLNESNELNNKVRGLHEKIKEATGKERELLQKQLDEGGEVEKGYALMDLGFGILAQPGGQTFLEVLGKGALKSKFTTKLANLGDKQKKIAMDFAKLDRRELQDELGLTKFEVDTVLKARTLDIQYKVAVARGDAAKATSIRNQINLRKSLLDSGGIKLDSADQQKFAQDIFKDAFSLDSLNSKQLSILSKKGYDPKKAIFPFTSSGEKLVKNDAVLKNWVTIYNNLTGSGMSPEKAQQEAVTKTLQNLNKYK